MKRITYLIIFFMILAGCSKKNEIQNLSVKNKKPSESDWYLSNTDKNFKPEKSVSKKNYYIILDASGSMLGNKIITAKKALKKFISLIPETDNIGLLAFDKTGNFERAPIGSSREIILSKIKDIKAGGATPLGSSVKTAFLKLSQKAAGQLGYGEYNLVIITDGKASDESRLKRVINALLEKTPIVIHTIGFQIGHGHVLNQPGKIYYKTANNFQELSQGLEEVLAESETFKETGY